MNNNDLYANEVENNAFMVTMAVRIPRDMREDFTKLCHSRNIDVTKVIRRFIQRELHNASLDTNVVE